MSEVYSPVYDEDTLLSFDAVRDIGQSIRLVLEIQSVRPRVLLHAVDYGYKMTTSDCNASS